ncbi:hypothetical protein [Hyphomicrobium sp. NDB2Meth4]|uniref:hypothetical protein n=1 Tax=Hyphomicrobium sp. NDB2Meth4 TaxID=1892846 RepID=UPI001114FF61|nr:hypothetical protein [Hyphomicrobium sp. NDB2Meth4]
MVTEPAPRRIHTFAAASDWPFAMAWQAKALMQNMVFHTFCPSIEAGGMADGLTKVPPNRAIGERGA